MLKDCGAQARVCGELQHRRQFDSFGWCSIEVATDVDVLQLVYSQKDEAGLGIEG